MKEPLPYRVSSPHGVRSWTVQFSTKNKIERPPCECGSAARTVMHHIDYSRWFIVAFLCRRCHSREHAGELPRPYRIYDLREMAVPS